MELDQEVLEYLDDYNLKEEKNKKYSAITCSKNIVYIFNTDMEFKNYFYKYGIKEELPLNLLKEVIIKITRKGKMICSKRYMDRIINELTKKEVFTNVVKDFINNSNIDNKNDIYVFYSEEHLNSYLKSIGMEYIDKEIISVIQIHEFSFIIVPKIFLDSAIIYQKTDEFIKKINQKIRK